MFDECDATRRLRQDAGETIGAIRSQTDAGRATFEEVGSSSINATYINIALSQPGQPTQDRWIIGFHPDCDFRVNSGTVSGVHCQIAYSKRGLQITDLNSTNGTFINQKRIRGVRQVYKQDLVTLGRDNRILPPGNLMASDGKSQAAVFVGKGPGNEIQVDRPTVSLFHARVVIDDGHATLEDLNSRNGTFLVRDGGQPCRIQRCRLQPTDVVYLGDARIQSKQVDGVWWRYLATQTERFFSSHHARRDVARPKE